MLEDKYDLIKENFPKAVINQDGKETIDFESLCLALVEEVIDLRERNEEKEFQIKRIFEEFASLKKN